MKKDVLRAIRYQCMECNGYEEPLKSVSECAAKECPLWPFRFGNDPSPSKSLIAFRLSPVEWAKKRQNQNRGDWNSESGFTSTAQEEGSNGA